MRNLYKVLGIASTADDQRIKSAFRRRAKAVHPDLNPGKDEASFIELVQAYEVLSRADTRASYDAYLAARRSEARRRFAHCAGLMAASFVLTAGSALFVMGLSGANVPPLREAWHVALATLSPARAETETAAASHQAGHMMAGWQVAVAVPASHAPEPATDSARAAGVAASPDPKSVAVAKASVPTRPHAVSRPERHRRIVADARPRAARSKTPTARNREAAREPSPNARGRLAAAPKKPPAHSPRALAAAGPAASSTSQDSFWSWLTAPPPETYYGLGASGL